MLLNWLSACQDQYLMNQIEKSLYFVIKVRHVWGQSFQTFSVVKVINQNFVANFVVLMVSNVVKMDV